MWRNEGTERGSKANYLVMNYSLKKSNRNLAYPTLTELKIAARYSRCSCPQLASSSTLLSTEACYGRIVMLHYRVGNSIFLKRQSYIMFSYSDSFFILYSYILLTFTKLYDILLFMIENKINR